MLEGVLPAKMEQQRADFNITKDGIPQKSTPVCLVSGSYQKGVGGLTKVFTHTIFPLEDKHILFRIDGQNCIEMDVAYSHDEAIKLCEEDFEWLKACAPDHESDREAFMANLRDQLGTNLEE